MLRQLVSEKKGLPKHAVSPKGVLQKLKGTNFFDFLKFKNDYYIFDLPNFSKMTIKFLTFPKSAKLLLNFQLFKNH